MNIPSMIESNMNGTVPTVCILIGIFAIGMLLRIVFTPWAIPSNAPDALVYLIEARQFAEGNFEDAGNRFVWPLFLSFFFLFVKYPSHLEYATLMKIISITVSSATVFVLYALAKRLAGRKIACISAFLFAIEPNIIENSTLAIREPIFLLIGLSAIHFAISKKEMLIPIAFVLAGISWDTRINGIAIFLTVLIASFLMIKEKKSLVKVLAIGIPLFLIFSLPFTITSLEKGQIPVLAELGSLNRMVSSQVTTTATFVEDGTSNAAGNVLVREFLHLIRINYPILIPLAPIGLFLLFRNFTRENKVILVSLVVSYIVAIPIYFLSAEFRNLFFLTPFLCIISAYTLDRFSARFEFRNFILLTVFALLIAVSAVFLYDRLSTDNLLIDEQNRFADYVVNNFSGNMMGDMYGTISFHIPNARIGDSSIGEPNVFNDKIGLVVAPLPLDNTEKLLDIIEKRDVSYIIIDDKYDRRYAIFEEILVDEDGYVFLEKVFDSEQSGYQKLRVKIYKINSN
jgi:hypothetical protein